MVPALVAVLLAAASPADTVYTVDGGRVMGTVLEESATSGVTVQTPDGAIRKLDRNQVSRIEFADGTVSTPRPPPQAAAAPRPAAPEGALDKVFFRGGGRARGTVMEESGSAGVKLRLLDGSTHTYAADEIARVEYADGTVSTPSSARAPDPAAAPRAKASETTDTVYFLGGGRVRGTVIEENPRTGVRVRLLDGTVQTYPRDDLVRIEYADGSVSHRVTAAPPPPAAPPTAAAPPPAPAALPPPYDHHRPHLLPIYLTLGLGGTFLGGDAAQGVPIGNVMQTAQAHVSSELGLRLTPAFAIGAYGDVGGGEPTSAVAEQCRLDGNKCTATTGHVGFLARYTWDPLSTRPLWLSLGTGWEMGGVSIDQGSGHNGSDRNMELFRYTGREHVRLGAGIDFRSSRLLGFGLYGSASVGEYDRYKDAIGSVEIADRATHFTFLVGARLILFP